MSSDRLGRYRILRELGRGSMGRVLLAHDPEIDRQVAIKTIHIFASLPEHDRREARERFLREVRAAGKLLHPGIVAIFDVGEEDGVPYLAMEYVEGQTLDAFCRPHSRLPLPVAAELVAGAAEALDYAHGAGIVHRDIKPANILRVDETTVKIMDFGLAKGPHSSLTQDGALLGTPSYMSPEQIRGDEIDGRSDLFSLAVVLYEMATGTKPFSGETVSSVLYRIVNENASEATQVEPRVPPALSAFLKKGLAKRPNARYPTGSEFAAALRDALRGVESVAPTPAPSAVPPAEENHANRLPPRPAPRKRSRTPFVVGAAVLFVLIASAALYLRGDLEAWIPSMPGAIAEPEWLETRVRTEPPGLSVLLDGEPLETDLARFPSAGPFGVLTVSQECREVEHRLEAADAGGEIVLVPDPVSLDADVDPGVAGARVVLNGEAVGDAPVRVSLDLCRENTLEVAADGYHSHVTTLAAGSSALDARTALADVGLEPIPLGRLVLPKPGTPVKIYVDGSPVEIDDEGLELAAGEHVVRAVNERYWIDVTARVDVPPGETTTPDFPVPPLAELAVQAFPSNCKVFLRRPGGRWVYLDTTPLRQKIASGRYELRVEFVPTGERREQEVTLRPGSRDPLRFSFAGARR